MAFTRLTAIASAATKGQWAMAMQASIAARVREEAARREPRNAGTPRGQKNKAALAKALAGIPAPQPARPSGIKPKPSNTATNKARLASLLADC
jgi:hypothetical protein